MIVSTGGIVIKSIKYSDSSLIVKVFTRELGLLPFFLRGIRRSKKQYKGLFFQPLAPLDLEVNFRKNKNFQSIKDVKPAYIFRQAPFHLKKSLILLFASEVLSNILKEEKEDQALFDFILDFITLLDQMEGPLADYPLVFLYKLSGLLGFAPNIDPDPEKKYFDLIEGKLTIAEPTHKTYLNPEISRSFRKLSENRFWEKDVFSGQKERKRVLAALLDFYKVQVEGFRDLKSPKVLEDLLK